jgi:hypothetical protein
MTTANTSSNKPALTLRDGAIKATIWANDKQDGGTRYSVELSRSYTDSEGKWHATNSFSNGELLRVARLAGKAYDAIGELRADGQADTDNGAQQ